MRRASARRFRAFRQRRRIAKLAGPAFVLFLLCSFDGYSQFRPDAENVVAA
jgi:hypothetical protein